MKISRLDATAEEQQRARYAEHEEHFKTFWDSYDFDLELKPEDFNCGADNATLGRKLKALYQESFREFHGDWLDA
jgi:hypothetical protein